MSENAPPATNTANGALDPSRGMPYYEKLRRDLRDTLSRKRVLDANLAKLEDNIYSLETSYLEDTTAGNIIRGFDNYIKGGTALGGGTGSAATRRRTGITDADRIFSRSSVSFLVRCDILQYFWMQARLTY
jgi:chromatin modification-related protein EAF6